MIDLKMLSISMMNIVSLLFADDLVLHADTVIKLQRRLNALRD